MTGLQIATPEPSNDRPSDEPSPVGGTHEVPPLHVPGFQVLRRVGSGGMGVVYEARQEHPARHVAIKTLPSAAASPAAIRRFESETQALGRLTHRGIAQLFEAGVLRTEGGAALPYMALEFIDGGPITTRCLGASLRRRLELFVDACRAVEHAHQRSIIHRDLKPANVLVEQSGRVAVVDFGVARILDHDVLAASHATHTGQVIGTLGYISPEQLRADRAAIDTRTDVYSLGALLAELLTGRPPISPNASYADVLREAEDRSHVRSALRAVQSPRDLETIVLKALAPEPERRYDSVAALREDVERFLGQRPILARRPTAAYRAVLFARRNRTVTTVAACLALAIVIGVGATAAQSVRARRAERHALERLAEVRALANSVIFDIYDRIADLPGSTPARRELLEIATRHLDNLAESAEGDPEFTLDLAEAYIRLGDIRGNHLAVNTGDNVAAKAAFDRAVELIDALPPSAASDRRDRLVARACLFQEFLVPHDYKTVTLLPFPEYARAQRLAEGLVARNPASVEDVQLYFEVGRIIANQYRNAARFEDSIAAFEALIAWLEARPLEVAEHPKIRLALAGALFGQANVYAIHDFTPALPRFNRAAETLLPLLEVQEVHRDASRALCQVFASRSRAHAGLGDPTAALADAEESLRLAEGLLARYTEDASELRVATFANHECSHAYQRAADFEPDPVRRRALLERTAALMARAAELQDERDARGWTPDWESHYTDMIHAKAEAMAAVVQRLDEPVADSSEPDRSVSPEETPAAPAPSDK